jgi:hypothetical protein
MNRKRFASLTALLAIMAFAAVVGAAQAAPHWYKKNALIGPTPVTITTSGNLTLNALSAERTAGSQSRRPQLAVAADHDAPSGQRDPR